MKSLNNQKSRFDGLKMKSSVDCSLWLLCLMRLKLDFKYTNCPVR